MKIQNLLNHCNAIVQNRQTTLNVPFDLFQLEDANYQYRLLVNGNLPNSIGVYVYSDPDGNVVYVGKAGSLKHNGYANHTISKRNLASRDKDENGRDVITAVYLKNIMQEQNWRCIDITAITFNNNEFVPGFVEASLLQYYFRSEGGRIPKYNKSF